VLAKKKSLDPERLEQVRGAREQRFLTHGGRERSIPKSKERSDHSRKKGAWIIFRQPEKQG